MVQWLRCHSSKVRGMGSIPDQGTKIPYATQPKNFFFSLKKKKKILIMSPLNFGLVNLSGTRFNKLGLETLPFAFSVTNRAANWLCLAGIELIAAFYGCLYAGCIPVTVRPPHAQNLTATLPTVRMIVDVSITLLVHIS